MKSFDCLIPFYNEDAARLQLLISTLLRVPSVGRIICIDDGSRNTTCQQIRKAFHTTNKVQVVRYPKNAGKSEAMRKGLTCVRADVVLTLDADMSNIHVSEVTSAYTAFYTEGYDLLILRLIDEPKQARNFRGDILLSGARFIRTTLLREVYTSMHPHGYAIEMAMNLYVMDHRRPYGVMPFTAHNIQPVDKLGVWKGIIKEIGQLHDIFTHVGIGGFLKVYFGFAKH